MLRKNTSIYASQLKTNKTKNKSLIKNTKSFVQPTRFLESYSPSLVPHIYHVAKGEKHYYAEAFVRGYGWVKAGNMDIS